ncbi:Organic cation/carnitine transporter [Quillaja saponaria]|uniref:Organic cation/carnitine transporter n=1 Tax=Quillaja saponaria TaxID=32244 RepID=A0AAD7PBD7_QUISA|nr:Organic cation/carnitine transporter [Quillaja saponaria]
MEESSSQTVLIPQPDSIEQEHNQLPLSMDDMIEQSLEDFGWMQFLQSVLVSFFAIFDAQQSFISIYTDALPTWYCTNHDTSCNSGSSDICKLPKSSWAWDANSSQTIISEWGLECANPFIIGLPQSSFFIGCLSGGFLLASLADSSLGRKNSLFLSCLITSIASVIIVFSTNVWIYSVLKFIIGFFRSSIGSIALVLLTEKVGKQWRVRVGILNYFCFTLGFISLSAIAYVNRDTSWKSLYLWTSIPAICYCVLAHFFVTESPRWSTMQPIKNEVNLAVCLLEEVPAKPKTSIRTLFYKSWAVQRLLSVMMLGLGIGMVYYGMPLGVGNLGFNIYLAGLFNALLELPSCLATYFLDKCKRKISILGFSILSGICSILGVMVGNEHKIVNICLELASYFGACTAFDVLLIYTVELFPTSVRNTATSIVRQAIVVGAIFCPFLNSVGRKNDIFSYGVFGIVIICCSFFVACLPETVGTTLCDTMDEQEGKERALV